MEWLAIFLTVQKVLNITLSEMARQLDVPRDRVSQFKSRNNRPNYEFLQKLMAIYPQLNAEFVLTGQGDVLKKEAEKGSPVTTVDEDTSPMPTIVEDSSKDIIINSLTDTIQRLQKQVQELENRVV